MSASVPGETLGAYFPEDDPASDGSILFRSPASPDDASGAPEASEVQEATELIDSKSGYQISYAESVPENAKTIVIATHGFCGDKKSGCIGLLEENANAIGAGLVKFDWPGHGDSPVDGDQLTVENCISDLETVVEYVRNKYPEAKLVEFATSFGGYIALLYHERHPDDFVHIILRSPAINMHSILTNAIMDDAARGQVETGGSFRCGFERPLDVTREFVDELERDDVNSLYQGTRLENATIIHGTADDLVPFADSEAFAKEHGLALCPVAGADHRYKKDGELTQVMYAALKILNAI